MKWLPLIATLCSGASLAAAPTFDASPLKQCPWGRTDASAHIVRSDAEWAKLAGHSDHGFATLDWQREHLLVFNAGQRPTPGYLLKLVRSRLDARGQRAQLVIDENSPPTDAMLPQVITWPCLILRSTQRAPRALDVVDPRGKALARWPQH